MGLASSKYISGETGTRTLATFDRRQISNLLHYHSATSPLFLKELARFAVANISAFLILTKLKHIILKFLFLL